MPLPDLSFNVAAALSASLAAAVACMLALSLGELPSPAFSVILFTTAVLCAVVALPVVAHRGRAEADPGLRWARVGLAVACLALLLQLLSFPVVTQDGGILGTSGSSSAVLYLIFHLWWFGCAAAGGLRAPARLQRIVLLAGLAAGVLVALDLVPLPMLLRPDQTFTPLLVVAEWVLAALGVASAGVWVAAAGRRPAPLTGWIGVSLLLLAYELAANAAAGRRYSALWWSSLSLRAAAFGVLAAGALAYLLRHMRRLEAYSHAELVMRDAELTSRVSVIDQLLTSARDLATAHTPTDVARVLCATARRLTGASAVAVSHYDGERQSWIRLADEGIRGDARRDPGPLVPPLVRTVDRAAIFAATPEDLAAALPDGDAVDGRLAAAAVLPLTVRGTVAGVLEVAEYSPRAWGQADRELLQGLADQGGPALSRARLALREHQAAETLQRSLLPARLPQAPGLVLSAVYRPAVRDNQVGGDWYDGWTLPDGRVALVIGDVVGKGLAAAATTGRLRASMRALAANNPSPGHVLTRLDEIEAEDGYRMLATVTYALLDPDLTRVHLARAGHPPPVLVTPDGPPRLLVHDGGAPIGLAVEPFTELTVTLPPGSALLLYTDGLIEERSTPIDTQFETLLQAVAELRRGVQLPALPEALMRRFAPEGDDVAVLVAARER